jgi:hypothetical protein
VTAAATKRFRADTANTFISKGREAAMAGIGITDRKQLGAALTNACGPFAFRARSAWLIGHEQAVRDLTAMAAESAAVAAARAFAARGFTVDTVPGSPRHLFVSDGATRWEIRILNAPQVTP